MTSTQILNEIYSEGLQMEIYEELHKWLLNDRKRLNKKCSEAISTIKVAKKLMDGEGSNTQKIHSIKNLCSDY